MNHEQMLKRVEQLEAKYGTAPGFPKTREQWRRFVTDTRLAKTCAACEHPGYMHEHAEEQYLMGPYGVFVYEAGDIICEECGCEWYEGDNWQARG